MSQIRNDIDLQERLIGKFKPDDELIFNNSTLKINKSGYIALNLNFNPNNREDYEIIKLLSTLEGKTKVQYVRDALLSKAEDKNTFEKQVKEMARQDTEQFIMQRKFEKKIQPFIDELIDRKVSEVRTYYDAKIETLLELMKR